MRRRRRRAGIVVQTDEAVSDTYNFRESADGDAWPFPASRSSGAAGGPVHHDRFIAERARGVLIPAAGN